MFTNPWLPLVPGIPLVLVSLCFNFIGDGLRDALDPRLKR
jgi:peptide/nickel transport system permease protein